MMMKLKNLKKLATIGALISALTGMGKANTTTNAVEETDLFVGTVKDIALANKQFLITSDDAVMNGVPVKLMSTDMNTFSQTTFAAGDTSQLLFTNKVSGLAYDADSTNAWYGLEGKHELLGNMDVSQLAISSVNCRHSAEIPHSYRFSEFPSPVLAAKDGYLWLSFIDSEDDILCVTQYRMNGNSNLVETAEALFNGKYFSKIYSSVTDGTSIWCATTDKEGQDRLVHLKPAHIGEVPDQGDQNGVKASCGVAVLGEKVYGVSPDQTKLVQFSKDLNSHLGTVDLASKVSAIASDGAHVFAAAENGHEIYKVSPENAVQTIVLDRAKSEPLKKIIVDNGTIYGATDRSFLRTKSR